MKTRGVGKIAAFILSTAVVWPTDASCHETRSEQRLSKIGPAPEFTLTNQDGKRIALKDLRGRVLAITFIFASCTDACPLLTATMAGLQDRLGADFGPRVYFVSITVDPDRDTPEVLKRFFEQTRIEAYFEKRSAEIGRKRVFTIDKNSSSFCTGGASDVAATL